MSSSSPKLSFARQRVPDCRTEHSESTQVAPAQLPNVLLNVDNAKCYMHTGRHTPSREVRCQELELRVVKFKLVLALGLGLES